MSALTNTVGVTAIPFQQSMDWANVTRPIVTTTSSMGYQISSSKNAQVIYSATIVTTATIGGNSVGTIFLDIAPINSTTPSDWTTISQFTNGQAITLAIVLQSIQTMAGVINGMVPKGWYARIRSMITNGSPSFSYNLGQEITFN